MQSTYNTANQLFKFLIFKFLYFRLQRQRVRHGSDDRDGSRLETRRLPEHAHSHLCRARHGGDGHAGRDRFRSRVSHQSSASADEFSWFPGRFLFTFDNQNQACIFYILSLQFEILKIVFYRARISWTRLQTTTRVPDHNFCRKLTSRNCRSSRRPSKKTDSKETLSESLEGRRISPSMNW